MFDFKRYEVDGRRTAEMRLDDIEGAPTLVLRPATTSNRDLLRELLKRNRRYRGQTTEATLAADMAEERRLMADHVLAGWRDVVDAAGKPVEFSKDAAREFLTALPDWLFVKVRSFAGDDANFLGEGGDLGN